MTGFVIDASLTLAWYFDDERAEETLLGRAVEDGVVVPAHWWLEIANGALMGERGQRARVADIAKLDALVGLMSVETDSPIGEDVFARVVPLARAHRLTIYDALYLELAERRGLALATLDKELAHAARSVGVELLEPA
ncbi:type II toxin-antitoxin system VapC family toxin [Sphingomonas sp. ID0503]|uniref:type II toxin-antitoxin system VapC family toxin n=1 Tax=Sphingomonas sp. ID0503 TaxID=3399691 RepID=UPI003AFAA319